MATLYRAIWSESDCDLVGRARSTFCDWVRPKSDHRLRVDHAGVEATDDGAFRFRLEEQESVDGPIAKALRASLVEYRSDGSRWTTLVRSWTGPMCRHDNGGPAAWLWVDVEAVSHDSLDGIAVAAPRFVRDLLDDGQNPNRHGIPLASVAASFEGGEGAEELAAMLTNIERDIPVVVFSPQPAWFDARGLPPGKSVEEMRRDAVFRAARMTAGLSLTCQIDQAACRALPTIIGESYAVRDGAFRIYLPGLDPALSEEWRHRYTLLKRYIKHQNTAGELISRAISFSAGARRAPDSYEAAVRLLDSVRPSEPDDLKDLLELAEAAQEEASQRREELAMLDQRYQDAIEEQHQLIVENGLLRGELSKARRKLALVEPGLWTSQPAEMQQIEEETISEDVGSPSEAAWLAQLHLDDYLSLPDDACRDLEELDSRVEARPWGGTSWRAFQALHAYAKEIAEGRDAGNFWVWCENSKHPLAWTATPKKLAMAESDTVRGNPRLREKRIFPVDPAVDPDGKMFMEAHIKIAEGGGPLAPRIYFVHTRVTGKVHVGYFGPHRHVPNTLT